MILVDSRRLTGPNVQSLLPGAIAEVTFEQGEDPARAIVAWREQLARMLAKIGWSGAEIVARRYQGGAALVFSAPLDGLLTATELNEWAVASASAVLAGHEETPLEQIPPAIQAVLAAEKNPALVALAAEAKRRGLPFLLDDKTAVVGLAKGSRGFPLVQQIPAIADVPWIALSAIPVALITGTNGKTTSSRLVARMAKEAGLTCGSTSTDGVIIGGEQLKEGDWTGPAGAHLVLRRPEVEIAILETARGGILRRGLAISSCDAALITNVAADHLGDYGIDDVPSMAQVKAVIGRVARTVVLNANDPELVRLAPTLTGRVVYFSLDARSPVIAAHLGRGGEAFLSRDGQLIRVKGAEEKVLISIVDVPLTFKGAAPYNVQNALGAAALGLALGLPEEAVVKALRTFTSSPEDNPGRGNLVDAAGTRVLIDFGHNPAGVRSVMGLATALRGAGALTVIAGMPGDRPDGELREVAHEIAAGKPERVFLRELEHYLRGRAPGEVPRLLREALVAEGIPTASVKDAASEADALRQALALSRPGDLVLLLAHVEPEAVREVLDERSLSPGLSGPDGRGSG